MNAIGDVSSDQAACTYYEKASSQADEIQCIVNDILIRCVIIVRSLLCFTTRVRFISCTRATASGNWPCSE